MNKSFVLTLIVISQFFGTTLWFSPNAVLNNIVNAHNLSNLSLLGTLTIATQFGFILGSLIYAFFTLADRFPAHKVFSVSILLASLCNLGLIWTPLSSFQLIAFRFLTGFFLAGVYPIGMKIAAYHFPKRLSNALGILVGALVLGTAFPHLLKALELQLSWKYVIVTTSILASIGSMLIHFVPTPKSNSINKLNFKIIPDLFKNKAFRKASFGYFGHMWELYAFWTFCPLIISYYTELHQLNWNNSFINFSTMAIGFVGCIVAGKLALTKNITSTITTLLIISGLCCLLLPFLITTGSYLFIPFLLLWGFTVVGDSPLLSTLVSNSSIKNYNGTALTLSTAIGFLITIGSIGLLNFLKAYIDLPSIFMFLAIGPILSILSLQNKNKSI